MSGLSRAAGVVALLLVVLAVGAAWWVIRARWAATDGFDAVATQAVEPGESDEAAAIDSREPATSEAEIAEAATADPVPAADYPLIEETLSETPTPAEAGIESSSELVFMPATPPPAPAAPAPEAATAAPAAEPSATVALGTSGNLYKCVDASGATTFQSRPCAAGSREVWVRPVALEPAPDPPLPDSDRYRLADDDDDAEAAAAPGWTNPRCQQSLRIRHQFHVDYDESKYPHRERELTANVTRYCGEDH